MCLSNHAKGSERYINAQLSELYENAQMCAENSKRGMGLKPTIDVQLGMCLFEFDSNLFFSAKFGRPRVEFVCNHEVILFLDLKEGHYNSDYSNLAHPPKQKCDVKINRCTIAFRLHFKIKKFCASTIDKSEDCAVNLHVLDMKSAVRVVPRKHSDPPSDAAETKELAALTYYLKEFYLPMLTEAGHHMLYSLPTFGKVAGTTPIIDYSVTSKISADMRESDINFGVSVADIKAYLSDLWFGPPESATQALKPDTVRKSFGGGDMHMHVCFRKLRVIPLCNREIVLNFDIQELHIHTNKGFQGKPAHSLTDWKIAFVADIVHEGASARKIKVDLSTARICEGLSFFHFSDLHDNDTRDRIKTAFVHTFTTYFLKMPSKIVIDIRGKRADVEGDGGSHAKDCTCKDDMECAQKLGINWDDIDKRIITHTHPGKFDFVTALTQSAINTHFKALWEAAVGHRAHHNGVGTTTPRPPEFEAQTCLADYSFIDGGEEFFKSSFESPEVQLVGLGSSDSVIFYLHLVKGFLKMPGADKSLQPGSPVHSFSQWHLAFGVDLKLEPTQVPSTNYKRLVLDLSTAKFDLALSTISGPFNSSIRGALIDYIQKHYFPVFKSAQHHVLYAIPISARGTAPPASKVQIVPFNYGNGDREKYFNGLSRCHRAISTRDMVVIAGMVSGQSPASDWLPRAVNWVRGIGNANPHGTVCLSRKAFLEGRLLALLEQVNHATTIVPILLGVEDDEWDLELPTLAKLGTKKHKKCKWVDESTDGADSLKFVWKNRIKLCWDDEVNIKKRRIYKVNCTTGNILSIPTARHDTPTISIEGEVRLVLSYDVAESTVWECEMAVTWSAHIEFTSNADGPHIRLEPAKFVPDFNGPQESGTSPHAQVVKLLKEEFPKAIDFDALVGELRATLKDAWTGLRELELAPPVFTRKGDLLLELRMRTLTNKGGAVTNGHGHGVGVALTELMSHNSTKNIAARGPLFRPGLRPQ